MDRSVQQQDRSAGRLAAPFPTMPERPGWRAMAAGWAVLLAILVHGMIGAWLLPRQAPVHEPAGEKNSIQVFFDRPEVAPAPIPATPQPQPQHTAPHPSAQAAKDLSVRVPASTQVHVRPLHQALPSPAAQAPHGGGIQAPVATGGATARAEPSAGAGSSKTIPHCTPPAWRYPAMARHMHEEGNALVDLTLGAQGQVLQASLHGSTGYDDLDSTALAAARNVRCTGSGGTLDGTHVLLPVTFHLH